MQSLIKIETKTVTVGSTGQQAILSAEGNFILGIDAEGVIADFFKAGTNYYIQVYAVDSNKFIKQGASQSITVRIAYIEI